MGSVFLKRLESVPVGAADPASKSMKINPLISSRQSSKLSLFIEPALGEMNLIFGYNTNGFAYHKLDEALDIIAEAGYRGVALTLDTHHCNPFTTEPADLLHLRQTLE